MTERMTDEVPEEIWLLLGEGEQGSHVWCDDPAPSGRESDHDAVKYVRADAARRLVTADLLAERAAAFQTAADAVLDGAESVDAVPLPTHQSEPGDKKLSITCKECRYFVRGGIFYEITEGRGGCNRWRTGYGVPEPPLQSNEVVVESDEGWCMNVGPDFGCVLGERAQECPTTGGRNDTGSR